MEIQQTDQFRKWLHKLRDHDAKAESPPKSANAVLRVDRSATCIQCVYFAQKGDRIMLLLAGGDKTGQDGAIKEAQEMLASLVREGQW